MKIIETEISDVLILEPKVFGDERGFFFESFNQRFFDEAIGYSVDFVQDNHSKSAKNVLRGLHYQIGEYAQAKLVRCVTGSIFDVAVDIRRSSITFGKWIGIILSEKNKRQLWIPEGFAHGFISLEDGSEVIYKTNNYYCHDAERGISWNDKTLGITWGDGDVLLSSKDKLHPDFINAELFD